MSRKQQVTRVSQPDGANGPEELDRPLPGGYASPHAAARACARKYSGAYAKGGWIYENDERIARGWWGYAQHLLESAAMLELDGRYYLLFSEQDDGPWTDLLLQTDLVLAAGRAGMPADEAAPLILQFCQGKATVHA